MKSEIIGFFLLVLTLVSVPAWAVDADPISPGSWTMILLPDTQDYCDTDALAEIFESQTEWIRDHETSHNIKMVLQQGDLTNHNLADQFTRAKAAMGILDAAAIPYSIAPGNHDYGPNGNTANRDSLFNNASYFGPGSAYAAQPHFNGTNGGFFESGKTDNSYCTFSAGGENWLVFSTEFGPRDSDTNPAVAVVQWMDSVAAAHPGYNFILNTHAYLYSDSTRYDWATKGTTQNWNPHSYGIASLEGGVNDGQELWDMLVKKYPTWKFTFNGHVLYDGTGRLASLGDNGNVVHQLLANYQMYTNGGNGYLRIMEFMEDGDTVKVSTYSPYLGEYFERDDQNFTLSMNSPLPTIHGVSAASIDVPAGSTTDAESVWNVVGSGPGPVALITPPNKADFSVSVNDVPTTINQGIMMATVSQNKRDSAYYSTVEVSHVNHFPDLGVDILSDVLQVATSRAYHGDEYNANVAVAFLPFADGWIGSHVTNAGVLLDHYGVSADNVAPTGTAGLYEVALDGVNSLNDGMLFAVSAANGFNYISTAPMTDGSGWEVAIRDNTVAAFNEFESNPWSFAYFDYDAPGLIGGRITSTGSTAQGAGTFTVTRLSTGVYRITIPGYTPSDGVLMLTVAQSETVSGVTAPADNIISYEASGDTFLVNVRDRAGSASNLQNCGFVFAFVPFDNSLMPAAPGDANYDGTVDEEDAEIVAMNWGNSDATWTMGDFNLDGRVGAADASIMAANWGYNHTEAEAVPEPSSIAVALAALVLLIPRRWTR